MGGRSWISELMGRRERPATQVLPNEQASPEQASDDLVSHLTHEHRGADALWADVEAATDRPADMAAAFAVFDRFTRAHLDLEEEVLFPEVDRLTGMHGMGPTHMMCMEHVRMRGLLDDIGDAVAANDGQKALDQGDTLMILTQQHNMKEEGMLYPMAANVLGDGWLALRDKMARYHDGEG